MPLVLAATSDLEETGILQAWVQDFQSRSGLEVQLEMGTDKEVFKMAQHGECDLLITHLPDEEERLLRANYVEDRQEIMHDDYIIVGPPDDPAGVRDVGTAKDAMSKIAEAKAPYIVRIDDSGTSFEQARLLAEARVEDKAGWLVETGAGMGDTLRQASLQGAYTLSDRSVFQNLSGELDLEILFEGDESLDNPYHVMSVSGLAFPDTDTEGARRFIDYLLSGDAQRFFDLGAWEPPSE